MLKRLHHGCPQFSEQLDIIDCICNYVLMEKTVFFQCLKFTFMMYKFFLWKNIFSDSSQGISLTIISI